MAPVPTTVAEVLATTQVQAVLADHHATLVDSDPAQEAP